mmetsp:Transcript_19842/g.40400  ORF Transcript_19842/g.40400 Transcript_19842/m.40400 type:complete len:285 (-) Transcript_19842:322-1176(-)
MRGVAWGGANGGSAASAAASSFFLRASSAAVRGRMVRREHARSIARSTPPLRWQRCSGSAHGSPMSSRAIVIPLAAYSLSARCRPTSDSLTVASSSSVSSGAITPRLLSKKLALGATGTSLPTLASNTSWPEALPPSSLPASISTMAERSMSSASSSRRGSATPVTMCTTVHLSCGKAELISRITPHAASDRSPGASPPTRTHTACKSSMTARVKRSVGSRWAATAGLPLEGAGCRVQGADAPALLADAESGVWVAVGTEDGGMREGRVVASGAGGAVGSGGAA